jgi:phage baseplate assembly protein W
MADIAFYKDLGLDFTAHPVSGDVRPIINEVAIRRSIMNLIKTRRGTRPFNPTYGCNIDNYLFSYVPGYTEYNLQKELRDSISRFEPRVNVEDIVVDYLDDGQGIDIKVQYRIKGINRVGNLVATITRTA